MGRVRLIGCSLCKVAEWGFSAKASVWSVMVVEVLEAVEDWIDRLHGSRQVVDGVEFVSPEEMTLSARNWNIGVTSTAFSRSRNQKMERQVSIQKR
jgi:hypothetical protein